MNPDPRRNTCEAEEQASGDERDDEAAAGNVADAQAGVGDGEGAGGEAAAAEGRNGGAAVDAAAAAAAAAVLMCGSLGGWAEGRRAPPVGVNGHQSERRWSEAEDRLVARRLEQV